jgi:hypothetical protein
MPNARPSTPGDSPSVREANSTTSACAMKVNRFTVVTHARDARRVRCPMTYPSPSRARVSVEPSVTTGGGSATGMRPMSTAEATNETASSRTATGAVKTCTSQPPSAGPTTNDRERVPLTLLLASTYWLRSTSPTKNVGYAVENST